MPIRYIWLATHYPDRDSVTDMDMFAITATSSLLTLICNDNSLNEINIEQMSYLSSNSHLIQLPIPRLQLQRAINTAKQQQAAGKTVFLMRAQ